MYNNKEDYIDKRFKEMFAENEKRNSRLANEEARKKLDKTSRDWYGNKISY